MNWPRPPDSARYRMTPSRLKDTPKYRAGWRNCRKIPHNRACNFGARLNTSTGIFVRSRSSIIAHTLEKPFTGGGSGPTKATRRLIRNSPRRAYIGMSLLAYMARTTAHQDTIVGRAPILRSTRDRPHEGHPAPHPQFAAARIHWHVIARIHGAHHGASRHHRRARAHSSVNPASLAESCGQQHRGETECQERRAGEP